ncbi:Arabinose 5-phosphate isomerase [Liberibacter crescens BT-1]|uniref:Arabinose 5-phosphate isomerase n=1 Tax=Liberibacter crescens (strain BT-1) TaxID=1215343 RepID=L0EST3_LIBCB|nr:KpsF/GutQ family sugar-phosphate isomerase [Liberibacter crescens]AGA64569.1 Arabinose 5-phosphate isomerase [Liberibacter crescens BT-1]AMC12710.1 D-arabinose 5-phosphate [Liberibacter crescens]
MMTTAVQSAIRSISIERNALLSLELALSQKLAQPFSKAVEIISKISGRVIVTGVGKSGHIGAKLAATLASTGTPAFFVHAAEANHGDLGMIAQDDVIIAMSWSGETDELKAILCYSKRFSIPLIAITSGEKSTLAAHADILLILPKEQEACPHGLAPTTSTMMQLAIGDALAVALLEAHNFSADDFRVFHPGGKLGSLLRRVVDVMHSGERIPLVPLGTKLSEAIQILSEKKFGCVAIINNHRQLVGIMTEGDVFRNFEKDLTKLIVDDLMSKDPKTVMVDTLATIAMSLLQKYNISVLIVVDPHRRPVGILHFLDLLRVGIV